MEIITLFMRFAVAVLTVGFLLTVAVAVLMLVLDFVVMVWSEVFSVSSMFR